MREPPGPCGAGRLRCVCWAGPLCVPVGGGPPARSPHASLAARSGRSRSPARPRRPRGGLQSGGAHCLCVVGQAPPPPTGTAAWPRRPRGGLQSGGAHCLCVVGQAPPPPTGTAAWPTTIPQHSRPALTPLISVPTPNFACNSPATISNLEFRSLELQRFQTLLKIRPIELHATFA